MKKSLFLVFSLTVLFSCSNDDPQTEIQHLKATEQYQSIDGVDDNLSSLDIYYSNLTDIKKPVVIYVHGGAWSIGDKALQLENKINLFQSLDYIFVSINYRLSPFPFELTNSDRIKYPDHNNDIAHAIKWIFDNIDQYGGDREKIALLGHSAGAHLVALTGTNKDFLASKGLSLSTVKGVAAFDTEGYDVREQVINGDFKELYINAFGTNETQNNEASPIDNISSTEIYPKFFIAKRGTVERIAFANSFINALQSAGVVVTQVDGSVYDHEGINNAIGYIDDKVVTEPLIQFFSECFE